MPVFSRKCAGTRVFIHQADHFPPHCNVFVGKRKVKIRLDTMEVYQGTVKVPPNIHAVRA